MKRVIPLARSRSSRERYYLIEDGRGMGSYGLPESHYSHRWVVANGCDRGNGYQGYYAVAYALTLDHLPESAKRIIRDTLHI